jgi:hypothetical protein
MQRWVLLAYRLPREPSTPRINLWRQLRRLGVAQISDGLVAVPLDARTREQLGWLAQEVREHDGEASIWIGQLATVADERALIGRMKALVGAEYEAVIRAAREAAREAAPNETSTRRTLARLRRELRRVGLRDYFPSHARERANAAVERLAERLELAS